MADPLAIDASSAVFDLLRTGLACAGIRELVVAGTDGIYEAGDLVPSVLSAAEATRRSMSAGAMSVALVVAVQDAGEVPQTDQITQTTITVRVYDRFRGYRNIRAIRTELMRVLHGFVTNVIADGGHTQGLLNIAFAGRTGHRYDSVFSVEYEAVTFIVTIEREED